jgi:hypothetical protein
MIFGSQNDFKLFVGINRELLSDVVEQEVLYYKFSLEETQTNIYGEGMEKIFWEPLKINCLITRGDQVVSTDDFGPDLQRNASFAFLREDLVDVNTVLEVGDIILWHENYYEVDTIKENQLFLGKDNSYNFTPYGEKFGSSISIIAECHLTRADRVGITRTRI